LTMDDKTGQLDSQNCFSMSFACGICVSAWQLIIATDI